jgi:hemerythrin-like domain-containing protein
MLEYIMWSLIAIAVFVALWYQHHSFETIDFRVHLYMNKEVFDKIHRGSVKPLAITHNDLEKFLKDLEENSGNFMTNDEHPKSLFRNSSEDYYNFQCHASMFVVNGFHYVAKNNKDFLMAEKAIQELIRKINEENFQKKPA